MNTRLSDLEQLVSEIKKFRPDCKVAIDYLNKVIDKLKYEDITESIVSLVRHKKLIETNIPIDNFLLSRLYHAREDEEKELFDALAKGGKAWDAEKKIIVNLKHKCEFKPFDKILGRNEKDDVWEADLFSHYREESQYPFRCIGFSRKYCIPYEGNEHLLGTRNNPE